MIILLILSLFVVGLILVLIYKKTKQDLAYHHVILEEILDDYIMEHGYKLVDEQQELTTHSDKLKWMYYETFAKKYGGELKIVLGIPTIGFY